MTPTDARRIAEELAEAKGWPFRDPVRIRRKAPWFLGAPRWTVLSNADSKGGNIRVEIDEATGAILASGYNPR